MTHSARAAPEAGTPPSSTAIELRHLRYFLAVFDELHFGRAAERLHMSQPPLSQAIRKLEGDLGVRLLERTSRAVTPTEAGRVFAQAARRVIADVDRAVADARDVGGSVPTLRIGCSPYVRIELLQQFLAALQRHDPELPIQTTHLFAVEQIPQLRSGELDIGIFPAAHQDLALETEPLFAGERLDLLLPPGHRLTAKPSLGPDDVKEEVLLIIPRAPNPAYHDGLRAHIETNGYHFREVVETRAMTVREVLFGVAEGRGVAFAPELAELSDSGTIVIRRPLDPPFAMPDTIVAWRKDVMPDSHPVLGLVREIARDLYALDAEGALVRAGRA